MVVHGHNHFSLIINMGNPVTHLTSSDEMDILEIRLAPLSGYFLVLHNRFRSTNKAYLLVKSVICRLCLNEYGYKDE